MRRPTFRSAVPVAALAVLLLAGCTAAPESGETAAAASGDCVPTASGAVSEAIQVEAAPGTDPAASFDPVADLAATQRTVVTAGDGALVEPGDVIDLDFTVYDGTTGASISSTGHGAGTDTVLTVAEDSLLTGLYLGLVCSHVGDRVVAAIPADEAFGASGSASLGIGADVPLVLVADVLAVLPTRAEGESQDAPEGFPTVALAEDGTPTVTIPDADPPSELQVAVLIQGDGEVVQAGDEVTMQYVGVNWRTGEAFDQSWGSGPRSFTTDGVIAGFGAALVGQQVGSQVIAVIPPDQGYGPSGGQPSAGIEADDTLVFVIDILRSSRVAG